MNLPTIEECYALFSQYKVPKNIVLHCQKVRDLSLFLTQRLKEKGIILNTDLIEKAALLHDWMKAPALKELDRNKALQSFPTQEEIAMQKKLREQFKGAHESEIAYQLLKDKYPELAELILKTKTRPDGTHYSETWENKILLYADWRTLTGQIISLKERAENLWARRKEQLGKNPEAWQTSQKEIQELEKELMEIIGIKAEELKELVK